MIRGTTAPFTFKLPYNFETDIASIYAVFWQEEYNGPTLDRPLPIIKCNRNDFRWSAEQSEITVFLEAEETARFIDDRKAKVQLIATTTAGVRFASPQHFIDVLPIHEDFELESIIPPSDDDGVVILDGGVI